MNATVIRLGIVELEFCVWNCSIMTHWNIVVADMPEVVREKWVAFVADDLAVINKKNIIELVSDQQLLSFNALCLWQFLIVILCC